MFGVNCYCSLKVMVSLSTVVLNSGDLPGKLWLPKKRVQKTAL